jgi:hypothetical protein
MSKFQNKTQATKTSASALLNEINVPDRRRNCKTIAKLLKKVSGKRAIMWGDAIVGYGKYHYKYDSGREGDFLRIGFSPRKQNT